jgi:carboxylesterase
VTPEAETPRAAAQGCTEVSPFDLGGGAPAAALCLHGLTGTPYEVRPLGEALASRGIRALGPVLPGHNESPEALARVAYTDWLAAARANLHALRAEHPQVFLVGLSLGGLLSLALAAEEEVDGLVVVGTPLRLSFSLRLLVPLFHLIHPFHRKRQGSDIREHAARRCHPSYAIMPLASVRQLQRLQRRVRGELSRVTAPILVAHGARDATADPADARRIAERVASRERELLMLPRSGHVVPVDHDGPQLSLAAAEFLARRVGSSSGASSATLQRVD